MFFGLVERQGCNRRSERKPKNTETEKRMENGAILKGTQVYHVHHGDRIGWKLKLRAAGFDGEVTTVGLHRDRSAWYTAF